MPKISCNYKLEVDEEQGSASLDEFLESMKKHRETSEQVLEHLPETRFSLTCERIGPKHDPWGQVKVLIERRDGLEQAFKHYISRAGLPGFVYAGSDYETVNKVLKNYGKRLARIWEHPGGLTGRKVKDL